MTSLLFIDDEEGVRRAITRAMKKEKYTVLTATDGRAGIEQVEKHITGIGIVISDYKMPGLDGLETLKVIGAINPEITRIMLTGYATLRAAIHATNEGLDGFLTKPFDNAQLRKRIHEIVVRKRLKQFVSEPIYEKIRSDPQVMTPKKKRVTMLFTDIPGFTQMSQQTSPEKITEFLNDHYFTPLGEIAYRHHGTVDKHMGDAIMVLFGAPFSHDRDAVQAVESALEMQNVCRHIEKAGHGANGLPFKIGIGVCTGDVMTGVFGSLRKKEYTVFGMAVNIAARLEKMAKGGEILVGETTYRAIGSRFKAEKIASEVPIKGLDAPIPVYRILEKK